MVAPIQQQPRERPILFSAAMVKAILAGQKTQTRRVAPPLKGPNAPGEDLRPHQYLPGLWDFGGPALGKGAGPVRCPYGAPGDRLWVKEGLRRGFMPNILTGEPTSAEIIEYAADEPGGDNVVNEQEFDLCWPWKNKAVPGMFCPRYASRIDLEVTEVRVQRLQEIGDEDARAEGVERDEDVNGWKCDPDGDVVCPTARGAFAWLWDSINGKRPGCAWADSPWVWAISFKRVSP